MSDCKIIYNSNNERVGVYDDNGQSSILFNEILNNGIVKNFNEALEIYKQTLSSKLKQRVADQLPLTLQVFERPEFVKLQGKQVNPITVSNSLNQSGIKQIEKDLIKQVIYDNYKGQNKVDYDELEATVRANIMPLERITTSSYADYGMDNLGSGNYGEAKTLIFNAPIEHGVTGHFSGAFKAEGRKNIKYVPKQLNDNTWVAVEQNYQEQGANNNNIYQFVGTAGTKEAVESWIEEYESPTKDKYQLDDVIFEITRQNYNNNESMEDLWSSRVEIRDINGKYLFGQDNGYNKTDEQLKEEALGSLNIRERAKLRDINKGMFAHIRVWQDGDIYYVAEAQSDFFQKEYVTEVLTQQAINSNKYSFTNEQKLEYNKIFNDMTKYRKVYFDERDRVKVFDTLSEATKENLETLKKNYEQKKKQYDNEVVSKVKPLFEKDEKQFIASQKEWEKRLLREALKEASLSGATTFRLPTPYTLSVIEGYLSEGAPYEIENANDSTFLEAGDRIYYAGEDYTVVDSDSTTITIAESGRTSSSLDEDIISQEVDNSTDNDMYEIENALSEFYSQEDWESFRERYSSIESVDLDEVGKEIEDGVYEVSENKIREKVEEYYQGIFTNAEDIIRDIYGSDNVWVSENTVTWTDGTANVETLMQPSEYKGQGSKDSFSIEDDLDDTQQTVARRYEEIAEILKKEKPVEIVTDENGFDWYEAKITKEDTQKPVVAFSIIGEKGASKVESYKSSLEEAKRLDLEGVEIEEIEKQTGWYKNNQNQWKKFSNEFINEFKINEENFSKVNQEQPITDVVYDNILYTMYPEIKNYKIIIYDEKNTILSEKQKRADGFTTDVKGQPFLFIKSRRSDGSHGRITIPHEITHKIQNIEGFATGDSPLSVLVYAMNITNTPNGLLNVQEYFKNYDKSQLSISDRKVLDEAIKAYGYFKEKDEDSLYNQYRMLQGEIDARAVQLALELNQEFGNSNITYNELIKKLGQNEEIIVAQAIDLFYKGQAYSISKLEPSLKYQTKDGQVYQSYAEALKNTQGEDVLVGINTVEGFKEIFSISSNTNIDTTEGFVNSMIKSDLLTGESYKENGKTHYKAQGKSYVKQKINAENVKDLYQKHFGIKAATINADNTVTINGAETHRNNVQITTKKGEQKVVPLSELSRPFSELKKEYDVETVSSILANEALKNAMARNKNNQEEFIPETELQQKLINLLKKFGIKTLSFEDYLKNYSKRNSLPISARALVDLTEKIVAFKDGIIENDDLVEEVAHLIESSIPMEQKENILRNIHKTQEWMQFAEEYSKIYETEQEVRKEIFGKVIANSIKEQFASRNTNETENSIIDKIKQFFEEFFNRINSYFKESYVVELEKLSKSVYKNLMNETLDLDITEQGILFSTGNASSKSKKLYNTAEKILNKLQEQHRELSKKYSNPSDSILLERTKEYLKSEDEATKIKGIASLVRLTSSQVETLLTASENKEEGQYPLSSEENVIFKNLEDRVRPSLAEVKTLLDKKDKFQNEIIEELSNTTTKLENLVGIVKSKIGLALDKMVDDIVERAEMSKDEADLYRRTVKNALTDAQKDTDWLHAHIGSLILARNPILNIAGNVIERMNVQKNENFLKPTKELVNYLTDNSFTQKDFEQIIKNGYIINELDQDLVEKLDKEEKLQIINDLIVKTPSIRPVDVNTDFKNYFDNLQKDFDNGIVGGLLTSLNQEEINSIQSLYRKAWKNNIKTRREKYFKESYIRALETHTVKLTDLKTLNFKDVDLDAKDLDDQYRADTTQIRINAGKNLSKADHAKLKEVNRRRQADANPRGIDGKLLPGIKETYYPSLSRYVVELDKYQEGVAEETEVWKNLSKEDRKNVEVIVGLNQISLIKQDFYKEANKGREIPQSFISEIENLTTSEEKLEFLENNSYISFPDEFYESFKENESLVSRLRGLGTEDSLRIVNEIRTQQAIKNRILRINSVYNKPSEINFVEMNEVHKNDIKLAEITLEKLYRDAKALLPKREVEEIESNVETVVNEAYTNHLRDSGENELEFILKNVTPNSLLDIETAKKIVAGEKAITKGFAYYFSKNMSPKEKEEALIKFAQSKLLPYLKRTEPKGYSEALKDLKSGALSVEDFIKRKDLIKVSPSFSFYEGLDENINPQWIANNRAKKPQWSKEYLSKVGNKDYYTFFNLDENGDRATTETKNKKYWDAREKILEYQDLMIEYNNLTGVQNRYMQPQVRRTDMERLAGTTVKGIKEFLADMAQFRPEEQETGRMLSDTLHSIPTYYNTPLEEKEELTKNYLYSYMMYGQAASLHKARKENISDMFIVEDALTASSFKDKATEATRAYMMFKNFMEYNFYGVKENFSLEFTLGDRTLDVGKILKSMNGWAKKSNLAGLTVPLTNLFQSGTQKLLERVVGETIDSKSANEGNKIFMKYAPGAMKEVMGFGSKSPLNVIGEALGIYNAVHRFEDSQYSKPLRLLVSTNSKLHEAANFPIVMRGVMGIVASYKIVDGKIISFNQFKQKMNGLNRKGDIDSAWEDQEPFHPYFIGAVKDGVLDFSDPEFLKRLENKIVPPPNVELKDYLNDKKLTIAKKSLAFIQRIDSQIPMHQKSIAQRDARANFFLSHLGFLLSAIPQRIRQRHYNIAEEAWQEGSWVTTKNFLAKLITNPKGYREIYETLDENQKKNLRRILVEVGFANALVFMALMLSRYNDDEEDVLYPLAVADLFLTRIATEQTSSTVGLPHTILNLTENPLMVVTKIKDWSQLNKLVGTSEERNSYLNKLVPFYKEIFTFSDPLSKRKSYVHFQTKDEELFYTYAFASRYFKEE